MTPPAAPGTDPLAVLTSRLDALAASIAGQIRAEVPGYAGLPFDEHLRDVQAQINNVVAGLTARQPPPETAIEHARAVGRRRAAGNLSLPDVIEAYHIAYREIWNELLRLPGRDDPERARSLVTVVGLLWNWFHRLSAAVAEAHVEHSRVRSTTRAALHRRLVDVISGRTGPGAQPEVIAHELGFDPAATFVVGCADGVPETDLDTLAAQLAGLAGPAHCSIDAGRTVIVSQGCADPDLVAAVYSVSPAARVGVGLARQGVAGAKLSLRDADDALGRARQTATDGAGQAVRFTDDWLLCVLGAAAPRLDQALAGGSAVAGRHPALARTVRAYADGQFSITSCARLLQIHPNSAKYRLDRWHALTGWDPRSFAGLTASMLCLDLAGGGEPLDFGPSG